MKLKIILTTLLFYSCTHNKFSGCVHDFDTNKPIKNVLVNLNGNTTQTDSLGFFSINITPNTHGILILKKEGYENKKVVRKTDQQEKSNENKMRSKIIYMFKNESDFSTKKNNHRVKSKKEFLRE